MKSFLSYITDSIPEEAVPELNQWCFVFPSKRAGLYFLELLQDRFRGRTFWSPEVLGIEDFVFKSTGHQPIDEISMVFKLYEVYKSLEPGLEFEKFYAWGQILLSDYDEIDRYLVDSKKLYEGLESIEEIEQAFGDNEEMQKAYQNFLSLFSSDKNTELGNRFVKNWKRVHNAYGLFEEKMMSEKMFYSGKIFRILAENLRDTDFDIHYEKVVFAGFNALSISEEVIIKSLLDKGIAEVFWDCDKLYMTDSNEEAGDFLRNYKKNWRYSNIHWVETNLLEQKKTISITGCPQLVAQAKYAGHLIEKEKLPLNRDTALVLADENMLLPVLHAIDAPTINVTMGYPIRNTSLYHFVLEILKLHAESRDYKSGKMYEASRVMALLKNTLVSPVFSEISSSIAEFIRQNKLKWVEAEEIVEQCKDHWLVNIFQPNESVHELLGRINKFLVELFYYLKVSDQQNDDTSLEIIYHGLKQLNMFAENIKKQSFVPGFKFMVLLYAESFRSIKIPFSGEPLDGLQVMGFLETRALDFKHIILLGVNENKLPRSGFGNSYIPFVARKAFGLPTFEEHEAIYAYHFKRVLQRAESIHILYDTEVAIDGSGEKSRFLLQLVNKVSDNKQEITIVENKVSIPYRSHAKDAVELIVEKSPSVMDKLNRYIHSGDKDKVKTMSPTRLVSYIDCKMQFYLKYVARVPETDSSIDKIDKRVFGNILHKALEFLYVPYLNKTIDAKDLEAIASTKNISDKVHQALLDQKVIHSNYSLSGVDLLLESVIKRLLKKIFDQDVKNLPFTIKGVEEWIEGRIHLSGDREVLLGGFVDRIDSKESTNGNIHTIIDYKTGKVNFLASSRQNVEDPEIYIQPYFEDGKFKAGFQAYYYAMLYQKNNPGVQVKGAIYQLVKLSAGMIPLRKDNVITEDILGAFHDNLVHIIEEILDPAIPFTQTSEINKCTWCPYTTICQR